MKALLIFVLIALSTCGLDSRPKGTPKFQVGAHVLIGTFELSGQVLESDCSTSPCKYVVRYLPPSQNAERRYIKETFDEVELKPDPLATPVR